MNKVPKLRFAGFAGQWEESKLSKINKFSKGSGYSKSNLSENGYPIYLYGQMYTNYTSQINYIDTFVDKIIKNSVISSGNEVLIPSSGETDIDLARASHLNLEDVIIGGDLNILTPGDKISAHFEALSLTTDKKRRSLSKLAQGKSVVHLYGNDIKNETIRYPSKHEQEKIANLFKKIDALIEKQEDKVSKMEDFKKSMLQKIFPKKGELVPEFRFKGFDDKWIVKNIGELMNVTSVKRVMQSDWQTYGVPFLRARDLVAFSEGDEIEEKLFISESLYNEYSQISGKVSTGDLLVTGVGSIGIPYLVENEEPIYFKDGNIIWLVNNKVMDGRFLYYSFLSRNVIKFINKSSGKGTVGTLTISTTKRIPLVHPSLEEQEKIGNFFKNLDSQIETEKKLLDSYKMMKKSLLQKLFV